MTQPYYQDEACTIVHGDCFAEARECDALITDCPYSERTHSAHDVASAGTDNARRTLAYSAWDEAAVARFVGQWSPLCSGWFVSITDTELAPVWARELSRAGRYVFSPVACVQPGSRVRISGDGPAQWSVWALVARPRTAAYAHWGALPGAYVVPPGHSDRSPVVGGKPLWLMERLVEDYTRPGDLVADPCLGGGTTLVAAKRLGRRGYGVEVSEEHCAIAAKRIAATKVQERLDFGGAEMKAQKAGLFG